MRLAPVCAIVTAVGTVYVGNIACVYPTVLTAGRSLHIGINFTHHPRHLGAEVGHVLKCRAYLTWGAVHAPKVKAGVGDLYTRHPPQSSILHATFAPSGWG